MSCERYEADLVDLARGALGDAQAEASVRHHLETCQSCAARFDGERRLTEALRAVSAATVVPGNDVAERRLLMAFAAAGGGSRPQSRRLSIARRVAWAAAACALFFVGAWAAVQIRTWNAKPTGATARLPPPVEAAVEQRSAIQRAEGLVPAPAPVTAVPTRAPAPRIVPAARRAAFPEEADRLAGFIPLPAADGLPGFDSGMIVRVSIPTASLPAYGLAITPESANVVNADLLVGQDGQARAIRLVSLTGGTRRGPQ